MGAAVRENKTARCPRSGPTQGDRQRDKKKAFGGRPKGKKKCKKGDDLVSLIPRGEHKGPIEEGGMFKAGPDKIKNIDT